MIDKSHSGQAAKMIQKQAGTMTCHVGIILGSGLGHIADDIVQAKIIPYSEIPGFPNELILGQEGRLVLGYIGQQTVACLQGRAHIYEDEAQHHVIKTIVRTLKDLGCKCLFLTNAAGSLNAEIAIGELMLITDHINLQITNPLVGPNDHNYGPRFIDLTNAYSSKLRTLLLTSARTKNINLYQGVYVATTGPCLETPAEIRAFRLLGGDVVGMSTVAETIVARHCDMDVAALSVITNYAAGISKERLSHEKVVKEGQAASEKLKILLYHAITCLE